jgi:hypothetical protein
MSVCGVGPTVAMAFELAPDFVNDRDRGMPRAAAPHTLRTSAVRPDCASTRTPQPWRSRARLAHLFGTLLR